MNYKKIALFICLLIVTILHTNCGYTSPDKYPSPPGYDLNHPVKIELDNGLNEISGIVYNASDSGIFAISDANGLIYKIFPNRKAPVQKRKFGKNNDYEDLQLVDSSFYILSSKGNIVKVGLNDAGTDSVQEFTLPDSGKNEFESLAYNKDSGQLIMLCKDCKQDNKSFVSYYTFNLSTQTYLPGAFKFNFQEIADKQKKSLKLKASATAINPLTKELFIISSVSKLLVITGMQGKVKSYYSLDPKIYKQPEGLAFTANGDLFISNESAHLGAANILVIHYNK
jgi:uncharacterized protein YjiK